ncbi:MAG: UDP-N-acetylglucosamine 2-epimerase [Chromatiaceae bacterium]|nr:UDP-N-acetylglucosamine 2-epimerase [Chromatiaceae bacterium]
MNASPRRICAVSGSRADYGLLLPILRALHHHPDLSLQLAVTGSHLESRFGLTADVIHRDGFVIDVAVPLGLDDDETDTITRGLGNAVSGFAGAFARLQPDLVLVLGDRYEILGAVQAALIARIPVAHIAGGDVTEGAFDDAIRHAITKMAHLHFVTHEAAARRVRQLGEADGRVFITGSPGIDQIRQISPPDRQQLEQRLGMNLQERNLAVTFHPATLDQQDALDQLEQLLAALAELGGSVGLVFTGANADPRGQAVNERIRTFVAERDNAVQHVSLGQRFYYGLLANADAVVGNSSSGLYEAPTFGIPTVNVGDRQTGRIKAASVLDCPPEATAIRAAIAQAFAMDCRGVVNPYGDGRATERIMAVLTGPWEAQDLLRKGFADRDCD